MNFNFIGDISDVEAGLKILAPDYGFSICSCGIETTVNKGDHLAVSFDGKKASITYSRPCEFFRAIGLLLQETEDGKKPYSKEEWAKFDTCGGMVDLSHGSLMNVDALKSCMRKMAMMGLNMFLFYREESYYVPEYEYFGYMRGRHTDAQIKELDDYAYALGIEIIPAIQCLGHLGHTLHWGQFAPIRDTPNCLLVGEEETYRFIECMLKAAMRPLRTKRVHIGFDETMSLGTGAYRVKHGLVPREDIFCEHLQRVAEICERMGLQPNIWADMFFRIGGAATGFDITNHDVPEEMKNKIPENIELTAWDYTSLDTTNLEQEIRSLKSSGRTMWFGGAVQDWHGFCVNYYLTRAATESALPLCKRLGVKNIIDTTWGDGSTERDFFCNFLGFQMYAEHMYNDAPTYEEIQHRCDFCIKAPAQMILDIADIDNAEHVEDLLALKDDLVDSMAPENITARSLDSSPSLVNPTFYLMWQDPLAGLFDTEPVKLDFRAHFLAQKKKLEGYVGKYPEYEQTLVFYISLCETLIEKCDIGIRLRDAYLAKDNVALKSLIDIDVPKLIDLVEDQWLKYRTLWFLRNQAFGFDVIERRYGGVIARLKTTIYRVNEYLDGKIDFIEELDEPRLPATRKSKHISYSHSYLSVASAWGTP